MYDLVKSSNFVLVKGTNKKSVLLLYCGEPKNEMKAFLQLEKVIKKHQKTLRGNEKHG